MTYRCRISSLLARCVVNVIHLIFDNVAIKAVMKDYSNNVESFSESFICGYMVGLGTHEC